jgi:hypothetical protein
MTVAANFAGFDPLVRRYQDYLALADPQPFLRDRPSYKPLLGVTAFAQCPVDIAVFAAIYEIICKLNHMLLVCRFYGTQEELGTSCILNAFTGDAVEITRTAIEDVPASDATFYRLHSALSALLQAYLQPRAAKEWRVLSEDCDWPSVFEPCWTEAVRLYDLGSAIATLTAGDALCVKCLDVLSWAQTAGVCVYYCST